MITLITLLILIQAYKKQTKKSPKNIDIYYIGYIEIKNISEYENIHSVNPLHLMVSEVDGYTEEQNGNKYLVFAFTDRDKEVLAKQIELWDGIKNLTECNSIEKINGKTGKYGKDFKKIKFNSDDSHMAQ